MISPTEYCISFRTYNMLSKIPCYWYANVGNISEKKKIQFIRGMQTEGNILSTKTLLTGILFSWWYFYEIFLWSGYVYFILPHLLGHNHFALLISIKNTLEFYWYILVLHFIEYGRGSCRYEIKYCETCQLQFYLKPDGLLCFITLAYQHNHLSIAFED